jgi:hypothetical protein
MSWRALKNGILLASLAANVVLGAIATYYWLRTRATQLGLSSSNEALRRRCRSEAVIFRANRIPISRGTTGCTINTGSARARVTVYSLRSVGNHRL